MEMSILEIYQKPHPWLFEFQKCLSSLLLFDKYLNKINCIFHGIVLPRSSLIDIYIAIAGKFSVNELSAIPVIIRRALTEQELEIQRKNEIYKRLDPGKS